MMRQAFKYLKEIKDAAKDIPHVDCKSNKLEPSESKPHGDDIVSKTAAKLSKIEETVTNKNTKNSTSVGKEKEELGILAVNKSPKEELGPNKKIVKRTKDDKESQKEVDLKQEKDDYVKETHSDNEDNEKEDDRKSVEILAKSVSSRHGKITKKIHRFFDDVEQLIEIQEDIRRLRGRRLYDSNDAVEIMQRYRFMKQRKYSMKRTEIQKLQEGKKSFTLVIKKERAEERKVVSNDSNPMSFKIVKLLEESNESHVPDPMVVETQEEVFDENNKKDENEQKADIPIETIHPSKVPSKPEQNESTKQRF